jgi:cytochrome c oxidase subunit IV
MLSGGLTIVANVLHPPRSFATLAHHAQHTTWEVVHVLAIIAFIATAFAIIALYVVQVERVGVAGLVGFVGTLGGIILSVGLLVPDSLIFPVLARDPATANLLSFPGPIVGNSVFTIYMAVSGIIYCLGTLLFFMTSAQVGVLPRWSSLLVAVGTVPLAFGALAWQGLDVVGAIVVGLGYLSLGYTLWTWRNVPKA